MRLIDADTLWEIFENAGWCDNADRDVAQDLLDKAPSVDAEPVRHGRWVQKKTITAFHHCSICGATHKMQASCNKYVLFRYCPFCGAKMDQEV